MSDMAINSKEFMIQLEKDMENYPPTLQAKHIAEYLGIGIGTVYKVMESSGFPMIKIPGSKFVLVPKKLFIEWYVTHLEKDNELEISGLQRHCDV